MNISTESSDEIHFEKDDNVKNESISSVDVKTDATTPATATTIPTVTSTSKSPSPNVVLFIQMEFCEKRTLRDLIDCGLYRDRERVWRLIREIVEGIGHIHQQVNLLNSNS